MKNIVHKIKTLSVLLLFPVFGYGQVAISKWAKDPFDLKVFVENKGQCDPESNRLSGSIRYSVSTDGVDIYFSDKGVTYKRNEVILKHKPKEKEEGREGEENSRLVSCFLHMNWVGADPHPQIIAQEPVSCYFTYPDVNDGSGKSSLKATAYRKIIYKNIYPNIDIEYFFPANKAGIKYTVVLHPGADVSVVKMQYTDAKGVSLDSQGNVLIATPFGNITDHAPVSYLAGSGSAVASSYELKGNTVFFKLGVYDTSETVIIDPWTIVPALGGFNGAYDVEYDLAGNIYVYGGSPPYKEIKYNSAGVQLWVYTATTFTIAGYYADFAVDRITGSSYIGEAYASSGLGVRVAKVNNAGLQTVMFPGDPNMQELWRMAFNNCTRKVMLAGSSFINSNSSQAYILDTNATAITFSNVFSGAGTKDATLFAIDSANGCYMANVSNEMMKCPANTLTPTAYNLPTGHTFLELSSVAYVNNTVPATCGMNGMAVSRKYLYTYDGKLIKRWNKNTGAFMNSFTTAAPAPYTCAGIAADDCDNIFVGVLNSVVQYDTNFTVIATTPATNTVFDIKLGTGNMMYVSGKLFVSSFQLTTTPCNVYTVTVTSGGSCTSSSATATASGGYPGYTYSWSPGGQATPTATGLSNGTYTVTITDNSCIPKILTATITISGGVLTSSVTTTPSSCSVSNGTATANPAGGTLPYTYSWSPSGGNAATATGLAAGNYSVTVTDATGCSGTTTLAITAGGTITSSVTATPSSCGSSNGTASVTPSGGNLPYTYVWLPSGGNTANATGLAAGSYSITVTDASGCSGTTTVTITSGGGPTVSLSNQINVLCNGTSTGSASVTASTGTSPFTYVWSPSGGNSSAATGLSAGNYSVTVTDAAGCSSTQTITITQLSAVSALATSTATACGMSTGGASVTAAGGTSPYTYSWSNAQTSVTATGLSAGNYSVTVTDANGCTQTATTTVTQLGGPTATVSPDITINAGNSTTLTAGGGGTYSWTTGETSASVNVTPNVTTTYTVIVSDATGCTSTAVVTVYVEENCSLAKNIFIPNAFSPNSDLENDDICMQGLLDCVKEFKIIVYNRWGQIVYESSDVKGCWDGTLKGKPMETSAVVTYYFTATLVSGDKLQRNGNISLLR